MQRRKGGGIIINAGTCSDKRRDVRDDKRGDEFIISTAAANVSLRMSQAPQMNCA